MADLGNFVSISSSNKDSENKTIESKCLDDYLRDWAAKNVKSGVPESKLFLPFLVGAPKLPECSVCESVIYPGEEKACVVRDCKALYHLKCARDLLGLLPSEAFKCPRHACFLCNKINNLRRCSRCHLASHDKCAAFPWKTVCWRHADDWPPIKSADPTNSIEEVFIRLPLPYMVEEFKIDRPVKDTMVNKVEPPLSTMKRLKNDLEVYVMMENNQEPPPYENIRRNIYHVKKTRDETSMNSKCTDCSSSTCTNDCVCRLQCISCSKACRCSDLCTNKPFRKDKKINVVLTEHYGWGVVAAESIKKGEFIIEYVGEVISDALCEKRLRDLKHQGIKNFYMCKIQKDFTIDATYKGNTSRFLHHNCDPNCYLEKWAVDGEIHVGVFAARFIEAWEPLTYDYRLRSSSFVCSSE
uniref:histone-lysine N-methyltransferase ASHR3-like n=1 Tax=Erigeron canadensis TaxID=72917 RepID=UPI001CB8F4D3|nr:histone-lysine N-methyltransferase ASHR3-like [Erigeron canadensis]